MRTLLLLLGMLPAAFVYASSLILSAPNVLKEVTLAWNAAPIDSVNIGGRACEGVSFSRNPIPNQKSWDGELRAIAATLNKGVARSGKLTNPEEYERFFAQYTHAKDIAEQYHEQFDLNSSNEGHGFFLKQLRFDGRFMPAPIDPKPGQSLSLYFLNCLDPVQLDQAQAVFLTFPQAFDTAESPKPISLEKLPRAVTLEFLVHRLAREPGFAQIPSSVITIADATPAIAPMTGHAGDINNRTTDLSPALVAELASTPRTIKVRRRESYLAPPLPLSEFNGPGECGSCRREAMKACFLAQCSNVPRTSMAKGNETIELVTRMNVLVEKYERSAASKQVQSGFKQQWLALKRELDTKDREQRQLEEQEDTRLNQCERGCQLTAFQRCDASCQPAKVGDRFSVPLVDQTCRPINTRLANRTIDSREELAKALGTDNKQNKRIAIHEYFVRRAAYEIDPFNLEARADRNPSEVTSARVTNSLRNAEVRVPFEPFYQADPSSQTGDCCHWQKISGVSVRKAALTLRGQQWDYDFYIYFNDVAGLEKFSEDYMRPFFSAGLRPEPGFTKAERTSVIAERLGKITDDVINANRGKPKSVGDGLVHSLRLLSDISLNSGDLNVAAKFATGWNLGWASARLTSQLVSPWLTEIQQQTNGTLLESLVGEDKFSVLGIERMPQRHAYRMQVKGTYFWPDEMCEVPKEAYDEVTDVTISGKHYCGLPNQRVLQLTELGETDTCTLNQASPVTGLDGCWQYQEKSPEDVFIRTRGDKVTADIAYTNRRYQGILHNDKVILRYEGVNPIDRAAMPWVDRDGKPTSMPASAIAQAWPASRVNQLILKSNRRRNASQLSGKSTGIWLELDDNLKLKSTQPFSQAAVMKRRELILTDLQVTDQSFAEQLQFVPQRELYVTAVAGNQCQGFIDTETVELEMTAASGKHVIIPITLIEGSANEGFLTSPSQGIPIPPGDWIDYEFKGHESTNLEMDNENQFKGDSNQEPQTETRKKEFLEDLDKRLEKKGLAK